MILSKEERSEFLNLETEDCTAKNSDVSYAGMTYLLYLMASLLKELHHSHTDKHLKNKRTEIKLNISFSKITNLIINNLKEKSNFTNSSAIYIYIYIKNSFTRHPHPITTEITNC